MTHDDETVERVARAIWDVDAPEHRMEWDEETSAGKERYLCIARAALSALPPRELLREALDALTPFAMGARSIDVDPPGDHEPSHGRGSVTAGDLRRARAAAEKIRAALGGEKP